jgi:hypothetical protein
MVIDAQYEEEDVRPCLAVIEVPVLAIDGTSAVGAVLQVRGKADEAWVVLEIGGQSVCVNSRQLAAALQSLAMLRTHRQPPPMHIPGPGFGG